MDLSQLFGGTIAPGGTNGRFVQMTGSSAGPLAGEADVMMISGIGNPAATAPVETQTSQLIPPQTLQGQLSFPVTLGSLTLPLWQWLLIAALLGGAGGYYLGRR